MGGWQPSYLANSVVKWGGTGVEQNILIFEYILFTYVKIQYVFLAKATFWFVDGGRSHSFLGLPSAVLE